MEDSILRFAEQVGKDVAEIHTLTPRSITLDTDGTPCWGGSSGTHYLLTDTQGPYISETISHNITADTDGTPVIH